MTDRLKTLLDGNKLWVRNTNKYEPEFFESIATSQHPTYLWIGCSDSRVPASEITNQMPGSIFVQRNIANMVVHTDSNVLSVVFFAVKYLKVKDIIVCGHYGCGGIRAAMGNDNYGFLNNWLMHIKDVYRTHSEELNAIQDPKLRENRFCELNVLEQVKNLASVSFIQEEWEKAEFPHIHGLVYGVETGLIKDLGISVNSTENLEEIYKYKRT